MMLHTQTHSPISRNFLAAHYNNIILLKPRLWVAAALFCARFSEHTHTHTQLNKYALIKLVINHRMIPIGDGRVMIWLAAAGQNEDLTQTNCVEGCIRMRGGGHIMLELVIF